MANHSQSAEDFFLSGLDLYSEGKHEEAIAAYRKAIEADPEYTDALHGLARIYQDQNRLDEAIAVSQQLAQLDPDDVLPHTSLSILYQKKGMIAEAEAEANKARVLGWKQQLKRK